jgi:hypothetical protein
LLGGGEEEDKDAGCFGLISRARLPLLPLLLPLDSAAEELDVLLDLQKDPTLPSPPVELPLGEL